MLGTSLARSMKRRWLANGLPDYPLWIALVIDSGALLTAVVAVAQRGSDGVALAATGLVLAALLPWTAELAGTVAPWPVFALLTGGATATLMVAYPVEYDFAPFLLVLAVGHVTACVGAWRGGALLVAMEALIVGLAVQGTLPAAAATIWAVAVVLAFDIGYVMRSQQLRLERQEREAVVQAERAALEERQRIAREVHDLVAHSLSVTMLHLTAARRDLETGGEVDEAIESLREAERVGRQAVSDVRRTVGILGQPGQSAIVEQPAPTVADLPALVDGFRSAGLSVSLTVVGDPGDISDVPPGTALGLYRIVQESLANVARHAPGSGATVRLDLASDPGGLEVRSRLPVEAKPVGAARATGGSGLRGMGERAELMGARLSAGAQGEEWVVSLAAPRGHGARGGGPRLPAPTARPNAAAPGRGADVSEVSIEATDEVDLIRVLLVDDQELVRSGLRRILRRRDGIVVVAECEDGDQVEQAVRIHRPDLVVMDLRMRRVNGIDATRALRADPGAPPVLVLTTFDDDELLAGALRAGASGFLLKDSAAEDLVRAVQSVAAGQAVLDPAVTSRVLDTFRTAPEPGNGAALTGVTDREQEVLQLMGRGLSNSEIAEALFISEVTVKSHIGRIFTKLDLRDRAAAIVYAFDHGLVAPR